MEFLTVEDVVDIHAVFFDAFEGGVPELDKPETLRSCVAAHRDSTGDLADRAALLGAGILLRQVFANGNHRAAMASMQIFLRRNGHDIDGTDEEILDFLHAYYHGDEKAHRPTKLAGWVRGRLKEYK